MRSRLLTILRWVDGSVALYALLSLASNLRQSILPARDLDSLLKKAYDNLDTSVNNFNERPYLFISVLSDALDVIRYHSLQCAHIGSWYGSCINVAVNSIANRVIFLEAIIRYILILPIHSGVPSQLRNLFLILVFHATVESMLSFFAAASIPERRREDYKLPDDSLSSQPIGYSNFPSEKSSMSAPRYRTSILEKLPTTLLHRISSYLPSTEYIALSSSSSTLRITLNSSMKVTDPYSALGKSKIANNSSNLHAAFSGIDKRQYYFKEGEFTHSNDPQSSALKIAAIEILSTSSSEELAPKFESYKKKKALQFLSLLRYIPLPFINRLGVSMAERVQRFNRERLANAIYSFPVSIVSSVLIPPDIFFRALQKLWQGRKEISMIVKRKIQLVKKRVDGAPSLLPIVVEGKPLYFTDNSISCAPTLPVRSLEEKNERLLRNPSITIQNVNIRHRSSVISSPRYTSFASFVVEAESPLAKKHYEKKHKKQALQELSRVKETESPFPFVTFTPEHRMVVCANGKLMMETHMGYNSRCLSIHRIVQPRPGCLNDNAHTAICTFKSEFVAMKYEVSNWISSSILPALFVPAAKDVLNEPQKSLVNMVFPCPKRGSRRALDRSIVELPQPPLRALPGLRYLLGGYPMNQQILRVPTGGYQLMKYGFSSNKNAYLAYSEASLLLHLMDVVLVCSNLTHEEADIEYFSKYFGHILKKRSSSAQPRTEIFGTITEFVSWFFYIMDQYRKDTIRAGVDIDINCHFSALSHLEGGNERRRLQQIAANYDETFNSSLNDREGVKLWKEIRKMMRELQAENAEMAKEGCRVLNREIDRDSENKLVLIIVTIFMEIGESKLRESFESKLLSTKSIRNILEESSKIRSIKKKELGRKRPTDYIITKKDESSATRRKRIEDKIAEVKKRDIDNWRYLSLFEQKEFITSLMNSLVKDHEYLIIKYFFLHPTRVENIVRTALRSEALHHIPVDPIFRETKDHPLIAKNTISSFFSLFANLHLQISKRDPPSIAEIWKSGDADNKYVRNYPACMFTEEIRGELESVIRSLVDHQKQSLKTYSSLDHDLMNSFYKYSLNVLCPKMGFIDYDWSPVNARECFSVDQSLFYPYPKEIKDIVRMTYARYMFAEDGMKASCFSCAVTAHGFVYISKNDGANFYLVEPHRLIDPAVYFEHRLFEDNIQDLSLNEVIHSMDADEETYEGNAINRTKDEIAFDLEREIKLGARVNLSPEEKKKTIDPQHEKERKAVFDLVYIEESVRFSGTAIYGLHGKTLPPETIPQHAPLPHTTALNYKVPHSLRAVQVKKCEWSQSLWGITLQMITYSGGIIQLVDPLKTPVSQTGGEEVVGEIAQRPVGAPRINAERAERIMDRDNVAANWIGSVSGTQLYVRGLEKDVVEVSPSGVGSAMLSADFVYHIARTSDKRMYLYPDAAQEVMVLLARLEEAEIEWEARFLAPATENGEAGVRQRVRNDADAEEEFNRQNHILQEVFYLTIRQLVQAAMKVTGLSEASVRAGIIPSCWPYRNELPSFCFSSAFLHDSLTMNTGAPQVEIPDVFSSVPAEECVWRKLRRLKETTMGLPVKGGHQEDRRAIYLSLRLRSALLKAEERENNTQSMEKKNLIINPKIWMKLQSERNEEPNKEHIELLDSIDDYVAGRLNVHSILDFIKNPHDGFYSPFAPPNSTLRSCNKYQVSNTQFPLFQSLFMLYKEQYDPGCPSPLPPSTQVLSAVRPALGDINTIEDSASDFWISIPLFLSRTTLQGTYSYWPQESKENTPPSILRESLIAGLEYSEGASIQYLTALRKLYALQLLGFSPPLEDRYPELLPPRNPNENEISNGFLTVTEEGQVIQFGGVLSSRAGDQYKVVNGACTLRIRTSSALPIHLSTSHTSEAQYFSKRRNPRGAYPNGKGSPKTVERKIKLDMDTPLTDVAHHTSVPTSSSLSPNNISNNSNEPNLPSTGFSLHNKQPSPQNNAENVNDSWAHSTGGCVRVIKSNVKVNRIAIHHTSHFSSFTFTKCIEGGIVFRCALNDQHTTHGFTPSPSLLGGGSLMLLTSTGEALINRGGNRTGGYGGGTVLGGILIDAFANDSQEYGRTRAWVDVSLSSSGALLCDTKGDVWIANTPIGLLVDNAPNANTFLESFTYSEPVRLFSSSSTSKDFNYLLKKHAKQKQQLPSPPDSDYDTDTEEYFNTYHDMIIPATHKIKKYQSIPIVYPYEPQPIVDEPQATEDTEQQTNPTDTPVLSHTDLLQCKKQHEMILKSIGNRLIPTSITNVNQHMELIEKKWKINGKTFLFAYTLVFYAEIALSLLAYLNDFTRSIAIAVFSMLLSILPSCLQPLLLLLSRVVALFDIIFSPGAQISLYTGDFGPHWEGVKMTMFGLLLGSLSFVILWSLFCASEYMMFYRELYRDGLELSIQQSVALCVSLEVMLYVTAWAWSRERFISLPLLLLFVAYEMAPSYVVTYSRVFVWWERVSRRVRRFRRSAEGRQFASTIRGFLDIQNYKRKID